ncbi:hypothetical protein ACFVTF_03460 [Kitasatospora sp. NPDC057940]|uniref:hypothetical protein n=1 Tax=Kitasatospora sp. NPDC057940 TaxID=3346285 RepID=UPI0036D8F4CE
MRHRLGETVSESLSEAITPLLVAQESEDGRAGQVVLYTLPAWKLEALWDVLLVLRRTAADDPETGAVRELLEALGNGLFTPPRTVERLTADLEDSGGGADARPAGHPDGGHRRHPGPGAGRGRRQRLPPDHHRMGGGRSARLTLWPHRSTAATPALPAARWPGPGERRRAWVSGRS